MDENEFGAIGFMFDASHEKVVFTIYLNHGYQIIIKTIGNTPGHKQSGQYLWPAAEIAANYLIENWDGIKEERVLELGAGCGLAGLLISKLPLVREVVFTDYDYGALSLIEESIKLNQSEGMENQRKFIIDFLEWGNFEFDCSRRLCDTPWMNEKFKLIIGTDLIYSKDVVIPLFQSVSYFLSEGGKFLLTFSFSLSNEIEDLVLECCQRFSLQHSIISHSSFGSNSYFKIEQFSR